MSRASLTGNIYGDIKAIEYIGNKRYRCQCIKCGAVSEQYSTNLRGQMSCKVCGEGYRVDLTGQVYGDLKVVAYNKETKKWICKCDKCGCTTEVKSNNLKDGNTTTCGKCGYIEHAQSDIVGGLINAAERICRYTKKLCKSQYCAYVRRALAGLPHCNCAL